MSVGGWEQITILLAGFGTLAIFSFLYRENLVYRLFEHLFIGVAAGFTTILSIRNFLWPKILKPMLGYNIVVYPDGTKNMEYEPLYLLYLVPMAFGLLYYFIYSRRYYWLSKIVIGMMLGVSAGLAFKGFFNWILPQLSGSFKPLVVIDGADIDVWASIENCFFVFTLVAVMTYFFFSFRREGRTITALSSSGRWLLMVCFGAFFGSTVMARMALLVERVQFLVATWIPALRSAVGG